MTTQTLYTLKSALMTLYKLMVYLSHYNRTDSSLVTALHKKGGKKHPSIGK